MQLHKNIKKKRALLHCETSGEIENSYQIGYRTNTDLTPCVPHRSKTIVRHISIYYLLHGKREFIELFLAFIRAGRRSYFITSETHLISVRVSETIKN